MGNTSAMRVFFFGKRLKFNVDFKNSQKKNQTKILVSQIIASELAALNCVYYQGINCDRQSMRYQTLLRLSISVKASSPSPISFKVINNYAKGRVL